MILLKKKHRNLRSDVPVQNLITTSTDRPIATAFERLLTDRHQMSIAARRSGID